MSHTTRLNGQRCIERAGPGNLLVATVAALIFLAQATSFRSATAASGNTAPLAASARPHLSPEQALDIAQKSNRGGDQVYWIGVSTTPGGKFVYDVRPGGEAGHSIQVDGETGAILLPTPANPSSGP